jgi:hypothetical protein
MPTLLLRMVALFVAVVGAQFHPPIAFDPRKAGVK